MVTRKQKKSTPSKSVASKAVSMAVSAISGRKPATAKKKRGKSLVQLANHLAKLKLKRKIRKEQLKY